MPELGWLLRTLDYMVIFARDMPAMKAFYAQTMEFSIQRELGPQWIEFRIGSAVLALTERGLMFNDPPTPAGALSLQLAFRVAPPEVATARALLADKGVAVGDIVDRPWGHRTLFFRDPDGNVLEIYAEI